MVDRFEKMALRNELFNRGITTSKAAELIGVDGELLRQSFDGDREITANELIAIISVTGIPLEKLIYKEPEETSAEAIHWDEKELMSKEYAIGITEYMWRYCQRLYFHPQMKPFNGEEDYVAILQMLNGLKEFIQLRCGE